MKQDKEGRWDVYTWEGHLEQGKPIPPLQTPPGVKVVTWINVSTENGGKS